MRVDATSLPPEFADLEALAAIWALPTENERSALRWRSSKADFQALYDAVAPRLDAMLIALDSHPLAAMPPAFQRLLHLALAFAEATPHVELYKGANQVPISFDNSRFTAEHGDQVYGRS